MFSSIPRKIIYLIIIVIILGLSLAGYLWWQKKYAILSASEFSNILKSFDPINSAIDELIIPDLNIDIPLDIGPTKLENPSISPDKTVQDLIEIKAPDIKVNVE